jgi:4'-phosphopantetheinyl transferase EntD
MNRFKDLESAILNPRAVPERVEGFRLGREAAHRALVQLGRDDGPILAGPDREPLWPAGVTGSISHAARIGVALVGLSEMTAGVGIDIEARRAAPELADQVPRPEELRWLDEAEPARREHLVLALFSAKESVFKAFFPRVGRFFGFEAASLTPVEDGFAARLIDDLDADYPAERTFSVGCSWEDNLVLTWVVLQPSTHNHQE